MHVFLFCLRLTADVSGGFRRFQCLHFFTNSKFNTFNKSFLGYLTLRIRVLKWVKYLDSLRLEIAFSTTDNLLRLVDLEEDTELFLFSLENKSGDLNVSPPPAFCCLGLKFEVMSSSSLDMTIGLFGLQFIDNRNSSSLTVLNFLAHRSTSITHK